MRALLVGYGEIGKAVDAVFNRYHSITCYDPQTHPEQPEGDFDILLVAFGYSDRFVDSVEAYMALYDIDHVLVFSTVPIGTCTRMGACHCPVEGKHPDLRASIRMTDKWLGGHDDTCWRFLVEAKFTVNQLSKPEHTEFLKLRSTTVYGLNIEFARYSKTVADDLDLDYMIVKHWDGWVNQLYSRLDMEWATRYILDPPKGAKGGHCVTPNARILNEQYPDALVARVAEVQ